MPGQAASAPDHASRKDVARRAVPQRPNCREQGGGLYLSPQKACPQTCSGWILLLEKTTLSQGTLRETLWPWLVSQGSLRRNHNGITGNQRAIDHGLPNRQIDVHQDLGGLRGEISTRSSALQRQAVLQRSGIQEIAYD